MRILEYFTILFSLSSNSSLGFLFIHHQQEALITKSSTEIALEVEKTFTLGEENQADGDTDDPEDSFEEPPSVLSLDQVLNLNDPSQVDNDTSNPANEGTMKEIKTFVLIVLALIVISRDRIKGKQCTKAVIILRMIWTTNLYFF